MGEETPPLPRLPRAQPLSGAARRETSDPAPRRRTPLGLLLFLHGSGLQDFRACLPTTGTLGVAAASHASVTELDADLPNLVLPISLAWPLAAPRSPAHHSHHRTRPRTPTPACFEPQPCRCRHSLPQPRPPFHSPHSDRLTASPAGSRMSPPPLPAEGIRHYLPPPPRLGTKAAPPRARGQVRRTSAARQQSGQS